MYHCLNEHPHITLSSVKEPNFFVRRPSVFSDQDNPDFLHDWDWYNSLFSRRKEGDIVGGFSISLLPNVSDAPALLKKYYPHAKFLVLFRNPIERTYSSYQYIKGRGSVAGLPDTFEGILQNRDFLYRSLYYEQLSAWMEYFPPEQFHVVLDMDITHAPETALHDVFQFLGVEPDFIPQSIHKRINPTLEKKRLYFIFRRLSSLLTRHQVYATSRFLRRFKVWQLVQYLTSRQADITSLTPETRQQLLEYYQQDIQSLEGLLNRNLDEWKLAPVEA